MNLISKKNIMVDFEKFTMGLQSLLVIGISGSGKSTYSKRVSSTYNIPLYNLDLTPVDIPVDTILSEGEIKRRHADQALDMILSNPISIYEGIDICNISNFEYIKDMPCVILQTGYIKSSIRAGIRNSYDDENKRTAYHIASRLKNNITYFNPLVKRFKDNRLKSYKSLEYF